MPGFLLPIVGAAVFAGGYLAITEIEHAARRAAKERAFQAARRLQAEGRQDTAAYVRASNRVVALTWPVWDRRNRGWAAERLRIELAQLETK